MVVHERDEDDFRTTEVMYLSVVQLQVMALTRGVPDGGVSLVPPVLSQIKVLFCPSLP